MKNLLNDLAFALTTYSDYGVITKDVIMKKHAFAKILENTGCKNKKELIAKFKAEYPEIIKFKLKIIDD